MADIPVNANHDYLGTGGPKNIVDGVSPQDGASVAQLRALLNPFGPKDNARVAAPGNVNLAAPGATIDGVAMALNDRVVLPAQTNATQNGIYSWNGAGAAMTRTPDADTFTNLESATIVIDEGTSAGLLFRQSAVNGVIGVNNLVFAPFSSAAGPASETVSGIIEIATQAETDAGLDDTRAMTPLKHANVPRIKRYAETFGDGTATMFVISHNLNTLDTVFVVKEATGLKRRVLCEERETSLNSITLVFNTAPALNGLRAVVMG